MEVVVLWVFHADASSCFSITNVNSADLNLPIAGICFVLLLIFLQVPTPEGTIHEKLKKIDWMYVFYAVNLLGSFDYLAL